MQYLVHAGADERQRDVVAGQYGAGAHVLVAGGDEVIDEPLTHQVGRVAAARARRYRATVDIHPRCRQPVTTGCANCQDAM